VNVYDSILPQTLRDCLGQVTEPWAIHTEGTCILANEAFATLFGYVRPEDVIDRSMGEFISPWPASEPRLGRRKMMGRRRNGEGMDVEATCLPFASGDRVLYQCLIRDITKHKSWEDKLLQSERLTAMGKLSGEIAHEINNPLGGILLYANLIREDIPQGSQTYANLEKIIRLATRCRIIAKGLLNFGRSSSKTYASVNLNQVIVEMFSMVEDHRILRKVQREMRLAPGLPHIMGDRGQIEQVVLNLVINAGEAMNGEGRLLIETTLIERPKTIHLVVEDSGPGIPQDLLDRIFDPFFTTKRPGRGTGLGLSITHGIVQRHGGRISVHSTQGKGTRFDVSFPLRDNS
jgi:two-component system NtrC family sensor kinase